MPRRFVDVTFPFLNPAEYEVHEERKNSNNWSKSVKELVDQRIEHAKTILRSKPNRTIHVVAITTYLPVLTVRELRKEIDDHNEWLNRKYLDEI